MSAAESRPVLGDAAGAAQAVSSDEDQPISSLFPQSARQRPVWAGAAGPFFEDLLAGQIKECSIVEGTTFDFNVEADNYDDLHTFNLVQSVPRYELSQAVQTTSLEDGRLFLTLWIRAERDGQWTAAWRAGARACCLSACSSKNLSRGATCAGSMTICALVADLYEFVQKDHVVIGLHPERASAHVKQENEARHEKEVRAALGRAVHGVIDVDEVCTGSPDSPVLVEAWQPGDGPLEGKRVKFYLKDFPTLKPPNQPLIAAASDCSSPPKTPSTSATSNDEAESKMKRRPGTSKGLLPSTPPEGPSPSPSPLRPPRSGLAPLPVPPAPAPLAKGVAVSRLVETCIANVKAALTAATTAATPVSTVAVDTNPSTRLPQLPGPPETGALVLMPDPVLPRSELGRCFHVAKSGNFCVASESGFWSAYKADAQWQPCPQSQIIPETLPAGGIMANTTSTNSKDGYSEGARC